MRECKVNFVGNIKVGLYFKFKREKTTYVIFTFKFVSLYGKIVM